MKRFVKFISVIICLVMVLSMVPAGYAVEGDVFIKVTDVADLAVGDQVIIVAVRASYALGTYQKADNRQAVPITKEGDTITATADVQVLTLEAGVVEGTFAFDTGEGYLFAASSRRNYLRTEEILSANSSWSITIQNGVASVVAQGENTHATMQYNPNASYNAPLFACYADASQGNIAIYKLEGEPVIEEPENPLALGNNKLFSANNVAGAYTYIAGQTGTLYITVRYYNRFGTNYGDAILEHPAWSQLLINGVAITGFRQTLEVKRGDRVAVVLTSTLDEEYTVGLHLSYEGFYEEPLGSRLNPVELTVEECPTQSVVIPAGQMVWYQLDDKFIIKQYCLEVLGEDAYIYCDDVMGLAWGVKDYYYYAENGVVTFFVYATDDNLIRIGNLGQEDASFTIRAYIPETKTDMVEGDNTIWLPRNTNGHDFYWTAQEDGTVTIRVTGEAWLFYAGVATGTDEQLPGKIHWSVEGDSNTATFAVSAGDTVCVYLTTLDADVCNPGGTLTVNLAFKPAGACEMGDVNGDSKVDTTDAKLIMQYDLGILDETALDLSVADVNGDGKADTTDAKLIMQLDLGLITAFSN